MRTTGSRLEDDRDRRLRRPTAAPWRAVLAVLRRAAPVRRRLAGPGRAPAIPTYTTPRRRRPRSSPTRHSAPGPPTPPRRELELAGTDERPEAFPQSPSDLPYPGRRAAGAGPSAERPTRGYPRGTRRGACAAPRGRGTTAASRSMAEGQAPPPAGAAPPPRPAHYPLLSWPPPSTGALAGGRRAAGPGTRCGCVVLRADGGTARLPGVGDHANVLGCRSPGAGAVARPRWTRGFRPHRSLLCGRWADASAPGGTRRVTVHGPAPRNLPVRVLGICDRVAPGVIRTGVTPRELEVLGLIERGLHERADRAHARRLPTNGGGARGAHPGKAACPTRTHAAVRAERAGLYVPPRAEEGRSR
jgi:hypothetical protein